MKKFLTAADILALPPNVEMVDLPISGGAVNVKRLSPDDWERIVDFNDAHTVGENIQYRRVEFQSLLMALLVVGEDGITPIFTQEDIAALRKKDKSIWTEIWSAIEATNPLGTKAQVDKAKENLSDAPAGSSGSK